MRQTLLSAAKTAANKWQAHSPEGQLAFLPFPAISDQPYTTYFTAT